MSGGQNRLGGGKGEGREFVGQRAGGHACRNVKGGRVGAHTSTPALSVVNPAWGFDHRDRGARTSDGPPVPLHVLGWPCPCRQPITATSLKFLTRALVPSAAPSAPAVSM